MALLIIIITLVLRCIIAMNCCVPYQLIIYTTIGERSSKFDGFLAARSQFDSDHGGDFSTPTSCQSATFVRPLFAFYCTLFFYEIVITNNAAFRHGRGDVYGARLMDLRNR